MDRRHFLKKSLLAGAALAAAPVVVRAAMAGEKNMADAIEKIELSKEECEKLLSAEQYRILREAGTEPPRTGPNWDNKADGVYHCAGCDLPLYSSETKYESGTGWPSFWAPIQENHITLHKDFKLIWPRDEVRCARCDGHLGHVFNDGPQPTGKRYCMNGHAMVFRAAS